MAKQYRDAAEMLRDEDHAIQGAATAMCLALGLKDDTHYDQARIMALSLLMMAERDAATPDAWKAVGFLGNMLAAHGKTLRLMNGLWWHKQNADISREKPLDNAIDGIVYLGFFSRLFVDGEEYGSNPAFGGK